MPHLLGERQLLARTLLGVGHFSVLGMTILHIQKFQMVQLFYTDSKAGLKNFNRHPIGFTHSTAVYWLIYSLGPEIKRGIN